MCGGRCEDGTAEMISNFHFIPLMGPRGAGARHVGYKMKFPLLDAYPGEHKIEVHRGGWDSRLVERGA